MRIITLPYLSDRMKIAQRHEELILENAQEKGVQTARTTDKCTILNHCIKDISAATTALGVLPWAVCHHCWPQTIVVAISSAKMNYHLSLSSSDKEG